MLQFADLLSPTTGNSTVINQPCSLQRSLAPDPLEGVHDTADAARRVLASLGPVTQQPAAQNTGWEQTLPVPQPAPIHFEQQQQPLQPLQASAVPPPPAMGGSRVRVPSDCRQPAA